MHKQYSLRRRIIDVPKANKKKVPKQPIKGKTVSTLVHILSRLKTNPSNPIIGDVSDNQPNKKHPSTSLSPKGTMEEPLEVDLGESSNHNPTSEKEKNIENTKNRENIVV